MLPRQQSTVHAAGGVVLITTKSGRKDMPTKLDVNFFTGVSQTPKNTESF